MHAKQLKRSKQENFHAEIPCRSCKLQLVKSDRNYALACNFSVLIEARFKVELQDLCSI